MVNRAMFATSPRLVVSPAIRLAFRQASRHGAAIGPRLRRYLCLANWLALYVCGVVLIIGSCATIPVLGFLLIAGLCWHARKQAAADSEHGTARLATLRDLVWRGYLYASSGLVVGRVLETSNGGPHLAVDTLLKYPSHGDDQAVRIAHGIWLGTAKQTPILLPEDEIFHAAIYGRSGSGKSTGHAIPNLLIDPHSAIVTDVKSELAYETARHRAQMFGHDIVCIAPFGGVPDGFETHAFNPLSVVNLKSPHLLPDAIHFAKALIQPDKQDHNPFFVKSAILVLDSVLSFLLCHALPSDCTLQKLRELTVDPQKLQSLAELMVQSDFAGGYLRSKGRQLQTLTGKTLMDVLATLNTQLFWIDSLAVEQSTHWTTFDIRNLLAGRQTIYLMLPTDRAADYSALIRVWITALAHALFAAGPNRRAPIRFYFDEASLLGQDMPVLERMLTKGRGYGIRTNFYFQSVHQIQEVFPEHLAQVFREQMSVEQFLEVSNYETAKEISQWIGQTTVRVGNASYTSGWSRSDSQSLHASHTWGTSGSTTHGYQKAGRALLQPEELLQLPSDVTIVLKPQCPPILARKLKSYLQKDYAELLALPFGQSPDMRFARTQRRFILIMILLVAGGLAVTHSQELQQVQRVVIAAWNKTSSPPVMKAVAQPNAENAARKSIRSQQARRERQRMPRRYDRYGY